MEMTGQSYSSGEWSVRAGSEEQFVERWTTFTEWSLDNAPGAVSFVLVRSTEVPSKFLSESVMSCCVLLRSNFPENFHGGAC